MTVVQAEFASVPGITGTGVHEVYNPAHTDEVVGTYPRILPQDVDGAVEVAAKAQPGWAALDAQTRFERLAAAVGSVDVEGMDAVLTREQGKVLAESTRELSYLGFPVRFLAPHVGWLADGEDLGPSTTHTSRVFRDPFGVVAIVAPWNVPIGTTMISAAPALLAGNAVVVHLPATAALAAARVFGQLAAALPPGTLTVLSSPDTAVVRALVEHPQVRHVHFTGSTTTGSLVAAETAPTLATTTLELGGNDAGIVLDDAFADEGLFARLAAGAFSGTGQACVALKRLYVPRHRVTDVLDGLGAVLDRHVVGDGLLDETTLGPLHTAAGRQRITDLARDSVAAGGRIHEFGTLAGHPDRGHFVRPALVTDLDDAARLVREEQFGPLLPILAYDTETEAVERANDSRYGLGGSVWSADVERASRLARTLQAGMTWVNVHAGAGIDGRVPWGGVKSSGIGRGGANRAGLEAFTEPHAVIVPVGA